MAAREYILIAIKKGKPWSGNYGDFQDYAVQLKGIGEPVKLTLPTPIIEDPQIGDHLYGRLFEEKGQSGRIFYKLKLEQRPEEDTKSMDIHAQVAIKIAVDIWLQQGADPAAYSNIESEAVHFAHMITNVRQELLK